MNDVLLNDADYRLHYQEFETTLVFDAKTPKAVKYSVLVQKLESAARAYWHAGAILVELYDIDKEACYDTLEGMCTWSRPTLEQIKRVYERTVDYAHPGLSFWVHKEAAALPEPKRAQFLEEADTFKWTVATAREKSQEWRGIKKTETSPQQNNNNDPEPSGGSSPIPEKESPVFTPDTDQKLTNRVASLLSWIRPILSGSALEECDYIIGEMLTERKVRFIPPTITEIHDYAQTRSPKMPMEECEAIRDFYQSKGWKVGSEPMKDWQAAIRGWHKNWKLRSGLGKAKTTTDGKPKEGTDYILKMVDDRLIRVIPKTSTPFNEIEWYETRA